MTVRDLLFETMTIVPVDVIKRVEEIVKLKCAEQRQICANEALIDCYGWDAHRIDKDSILNAPEPEI